MLVIKGNIFQTLKTAIFKLSTFYGKLL